ncbi:response regulator [Fulvivirgaceae bacterium PWU4]|uniref:Response regulator n=1 Tax=Chryseosolibacter histidini TaxID=2782349 RepID=A0AAP2GKQ0_9BACT|nr:response regulator [Chryseosolibacter histidini]MBT1699546.1 response regulator [Chryseosolibacter histidini]
MTILFIDDDPDDRELFCEAAAYLNETELISISHNTINCLTATNGSVAIKLIQNLETPPALIFMDINMPIMGGEECLQLLKSSERYSGIPVIMLSTTCTEEQVRALKSMGAVDCIVKPTSFNALVKALSKYVYAKYF